MPTRPERVNVLNTTPVFYIGHIRAAVEVFARRTGTPEANVVVSHIDYRVGAMGYAEAEDLSVVDQIAQIARLLDEERNAKSRLNELRRELADLGLSYDIIF